MGNPAATLQLGLSLPSGPAQGANLQGHPWGNLVSTASDHNYMNYSLKALHFAASTVYAASLQ